jgi:Rrf2 family protein
MALNRHADYAIRTVLFLALQEAGSVVPRRRVVEAMGIPDSYFRKIATELGRAGVVQMTRGPRGGCRLVPDPARLTLLQVIEATVGPVYLNDCVVRPAGCGRSATCAVHEVCVAATDRLRSLLGGVTFADLAQRESCLLAEAHGRRSPTRRRRRR